VCASSAGRATSARPVNGRRAKPSTPNTRLLRLHSPFDRQRSRMSAAIARISDGRQNPSSVENTLDCQIPAAVCAYTGLISGGSIPPSVSRNQCDGQTRCSSTYQPTRATRMYQGMWRARIVRKLRYGMSETPHAQRRIWLYVLLAEPSGVRPSAASA